MSSIVSIVLLSLLVTPLPARAGKTDVSAEYARQVSATQLRAAQLEAELVGLTQRTEQLEEVIRLQGRSEANRLENIDQVNSEIAKLRGQAEVVQFELKALKDSLDQLQLATERRVLHAEMRLRNIEQTLRIKPPPPPTLAELGGEGPDPAASDGTAAPEAAEAEEMPPTAEGKLQLAAEHMGAGRHAVARAILRMAIDSHTGSPEVAEARYRYAETFANEKNWREATLGFQSVIDNHGKSPWACWAYYRQGEAVENLYGMEDAKTFYVAATEGGCKGSEAARAAAKKLGK